MKKATEKGIITNKVDAVAYIKENGIPEVGTFADDKSLKKFYKQLDQAQIDSWVTLEGLTFKACLDQPAIHRMRACMTILYLHFPKEVKAKKESPYKQYTTEALVQLAIDKDIVFEACEDERILRMRAIMALRASKAI